MWKERQVAFGSSQLSPATLRFLPHIPSRPNKQSLLIAVNESCFKTLEMLPNADFQPENNFLESK